MRAAVLGSGGIGGYYGTLLARSGHDVAFIARGAHLEAMQGRGLTVRTSEGESTIPVTASADTASIGTVDLRMGGEGKLVFGELSGPVTERVQRIAEAFRQSIPQEVTTDIQRVLWDTFLFITGISGVTALARSGIGPLLASAAGCTLLRAACWEIVAVAQAEGALLQPAAVDTFLAQAPMLPAPWRSSMARALEEGRRLEVDALSGAVVRRGLKQGVPTPVHQTIVACLSVHQPSASNDARNPGVLSDSSLSEEAVMRLTDNVAIVTDTGSGIGAAIARTFEREGAKVAGQPLRM